MLNHPCARLLQGAHPGECHRPLAWGRAPFWQHQIPHCMPRVTLPVHHSTAAPACERLPDSAHLGGAGLFVVEVEINDVAHLLPAPVHYPIVPVKRQAAAKPAGKSRHGTAAGGSKDKSVNLVVLTDTIFRLLPAT